jgi:23S rRNA pseudouridine955/2504/2580 synthase
MDFRTYKITMDDANRRVDRIIRRFLPELSLSAVYKLLRKGLIRVDGARVSPDFHVNAGSSIMIAAIVDSAQPGYTSQPGCDQETVADSKVLNPIVSCKLEVLLETDDLVFINKPVGIPVHGEGGLDALVPSSERADNSLSFRTGPLHRLDRDTSGVIAFSRSLAGAQWFSSSVSAHAFEKYYLGIARGHLEADAEWQDMSDDGKEMITLACPLAFSENRDFSLVRYRIITGRKHQIRIQTALHGHPLAGDRLYERNMNGTNASFALNAPGPTYFLHAWQIVFGTERLAGLSESVRAPLPEAYKQAVKKLFGESVLVNIDRGDLYWSENEELQ